MTVLTEKKLDEILEYLEKSITNLAKQSFETLEMNDHGSLSNFLEGQFDIRLENLLNANQSSIHHLESSMKNKIIQKKQSIIEKINQQYMF